MASSDTESDICLTAPNAQLYIFFPRKTANEILDFSISEYCRDPSPWETRGTQLMVMRGTCYQPDHHHPDSPKDMHGAVILSGPPQGKANDVSASPIQGRSNDAGRA